jgi:hypothetical protein
MGGTSAPKKVVQLVERFDRNRDSYLDGGTMNEERIRRTNDVPVYELRGLTEEKISIMEGV